MKESEITTGNPGREFVVAGADQPTFRIHLDHVGYQIARVDRGDQAAAIDQIVGGGDAILRDRA